MICDGCGHGLPDNAKFCPECGRPVTPAPADDTPADKSDAGDLTGAPREASSAPETDGVPPTASIPKAEPAPVPDGLEVTREQARPRDLDEAAGGPREGT